MLRKLNMIFVSETVSLDALLQIIDGMNGFVWRQPGWLNGILHKEKKNGRRTFIVWYDLNISEDFYTLTGRRSWKTPMLFEKALMGIGNTSMVYSQNLFEEQSKLPLVFGFQGASFVEYKPQRNKTQSCPLPDYFKHQYNKFCMKDKLPRVIFPIVPDEGIFNYDVKVTFSDTDHNRHVNICSYIRYCLDCGSKASVAGFYKSLEGDIAKYQVRQLKIVYNGEAFEGDSLIIKTWEDTTNNKENGYAGPVIYCAVIKNDKLIVRSAFTFHKKIKISKL